MADTKVMSKIKYDTIAQALIAFQSDLPVIVKDSRADTGKYGYDYASLPALTPILFEKLTTVGIAYVAQPTMEDGVFGLRAELIHESGERIGGLYPLGNPNNPAQAIGSAITYARRYALLSLTGVAPEGSDDDGATASAAQASPAGQATATAAAKPNSAADMHAKMGALINANAQYISGEDANTVMANVTDGKPAAAWTAANLKAGLVELEALLNTRKASDAS
jgi:hypothetical protein